MWRCPKIFPQVTTASPRCIEAFGAAEHRLPIEAAQGVDEARYGTAGGAVPVPEFTQKCWVFTTENDG